MARKRWIWIVAVALVGALAVMGVWLVNGPIAYARIATGYVAQQTCACLNVSHRSQESCTAEFPADAVKMIKVEVNGDNVRASTLGGVIASEARADGAYGCSITK